MKPVILLSAIAMALSACVETDLVIAPGAVSATDNPNENPYVASVVANLRKGLPAPRVEGALNGKFLSANIAEGGDFHCRVYELEGNGIRNNTTFVTVNFYENRVVNTENDYTKRSCKARVFPELLDS